MSSIFSFIKRCNNILLNESTPDVKTAKKYLLTDRNFFVEGCKTHQIGYCNDDVEIPNDVRFFGMEDKADEEKWDMSSRIRNRIIVPIFSEFNKPVAIATRVPTTKPGNPWWNLPRPFIKGNHLFLLDKARKESFRKNKMYIVEGYMDALTLFEHGLKNVCAVMGTSYSHRKIALTARYCNNVCFCFDSDSNEAGTIAKKVSIAMLEKYSFCNSISVIDDLPIGEDPASFVGENSIEKFLSMEKVLDDIGINKICQEVRSGKNNKLLDAK